MEAEVTVYGGIQPYLIYASARCSGILTITEIIREEEHETFTVRSLGPPGDCVVAVEDKGWPADDLFLNFEVQRTKPGALQEVAEKPPDPVAQKGPSGTSRLRE